MTSKRLLSAGVASAMCALAAIVLLLIGVSRPIRDDVLRGPALLAAAGGAVGIVVGGVLGWTRLVDALSDRRPRRVVLVTAAQAVILGAALVATVLTIGTTHWPARVTDVTTDRIGELILAPLFQDLFLAGLAFVWGLVVFGLPAVVLITPIVALWRWLVRRLVGHPDR